MNQSYRMTDPVMPESLYADWQCMHAAKTPVLNKFNDNKLGMFIHWGIYAVCAGEWKGRRVPGISEWVMFRECIDRREYEQLAEQFTPHKFNAAEWVGMAKDAGMKYIVITAKHHDGFALFSSRHSPYNIVDATSCGLEPLDMLYDECQKQGIGFGVYFSHVIDWHDGWCGEGGCPKECTDIRTRSIANPMNTWDPTDNTRKAFFENKSYPQLQELLERYPNLYLVWFDYWYEGKYINPPESYKFYKMIYDANPQCLVNSRVGHELGDYISAPDNQVMEEGQSKLWETPGTLNNTWGYSKFDNDWKSELELIFWLVKIVSRGGNYLLNIGPKADGSIPDATIASFKAIGNWMKVNSEAIYGTTAWSTNHEGPTNLDIEGTDQREATGFSGCFSSKDFWFTCKGSAIYSIALVRPENPEVLIKSLTTDRINVKVVEMLGCGQALKWNCTPDGLKVLLPEIETGTIGYVLKITSGNMENE